MSQRDPRDLGIARDFLAELSSRLNLDPALMENAMPHLLGMTKHVAHGVVRPAAPLAAFLVGYAAGGEGADGIPAPERVLAALEQVEALIEEYRENHGQA
ncbi:MAG: DUF6457 domain-containing protein [Rothia sp. (in: high G+C Gram-positive bacteria)]|uniref:DUF6457 domain-containing protein n=1 Tax=Rothia sp. (in: high G+C Gram-positive bacteria) TaxID=1885016 RepID=UPI002702B171|nr:DUF6457 domain-containing protein [Rothia sp. (in: high G+C Gram-positive bacteria)]